MKYHTFQLSTGYAESASIGTVTVTHESYFESVTDGLYYFGDAIKKSLEQLIVYHNSDVERREKEGHIEQRECCKTTLLASSTKIMCAKCFMPIRKKNIEVSIEEVNDEVNKMIRLTNDEYGYDVTQEMESFGWYCGYSPFHPKEQEEIAFVDVSVFSWHPSLKEGKIPNGLEWSEYEMKLVKKVLPKWNFEE